MASLSHNDGGSLSRFLAIFKRALRKICRSRSWQIHTDGPLPLRAAYRSGRADLIAMGGVLPANPKTKKPGSMSYFAAKHVSTAIVIWCPSDPAATSAEQREHHRRSFDRLKRSIGYITRGNKNLETLTYDRIMMRIHERITLYDLIQAANASLKEIKRRANNCQLDLDLVDILMTNNQRTEEQQAVVNDLIASLPDNLRPLAVLRMEGRTWKEIAEMLKLSESTVYRMLADLRDEL